MTQKRESSSLNTKSLIHRNWRGGDLNGFPFDVIIVASYRDADRIDENLRRMNFPPSQVLVLFDRSNLRDPRYRLGHISPPSLVDPRESIKIGVIREYVSDKGEGPIMS